MIRVPEVPEPDEFASARKKGEAWLESHRTQKAPDLWSEFRGHLARGFEDRCGYTAMYTNSGQVDHYRCQHDHRALIYEWSNYRYCSGEVNSRKGRKDVLDPYTIDSRWFQILYPSLQLVLTAAVPEAEQPRARRTIVELGLRDGEFIIKARRKWLAMYGKRRLNLDGLHEVAPLLAEMVERHDLTPERVVRTFRLEM